MWTWFRPDSPSLTSSRAPIRPSRLVTPRHRAESGESQVVEYPPPGEWRGIRQAHWGDADSPLHDTGWRRPVQIPGLGTGEGDDEYDSDHSQAAALVTTSPSPSSPGPTTSLPRTLPSRPRIDAFLAAAPPEPNDAVVSDEEAFHSQALVGIAETWEGGGCHPVALFKAMLSAAGCGRRSALLRREELRRPLTPCSKIPPLPSYTHPPETTAGQTAEQTRYYARRAERESVNNN